MASERDNDDIAAALHGLSAGDVHDEHHDAAHDEPSADAGHAAPTPAAARPPADRATRPSRPAAPGAPPRPAAAPQRARPAGPPPAAGANAGAAAPSAKPAGSKRPAVPAAAPPAAPPPRAAVPARTPTSSSGRPARPAAPGQPVEDAYDQSAVDDPAAAATIDYRSSPARAKPAPARRPSILVSVGFRRTLIPIALTTGVMLIATGVTQKLVDDAAPLSRLPGWFAIVLPLVGLMLIALGVGNMVLVRNQLAKKPNG